MVVLGFLLVVAAVLAGLGVGISSSSSASIEGFGMEVETTAAIVFFAGVVTAVAALAGLWLMKKGTARTYRRRKEVKTLRQKVETAPSEPVASSEPVGSEPVGSEPVGRHSAEADERRVTPEEAMQDDGTGVEGGGDRGRPATTR